MFEILTDATAKGFGLNHKWDVKYNALAVYNEIAGGNTDSNIIGTAFIKEAVRCVNDRFRQRSERYLNQPDKVTYIYDMLFDKLVINDALIQKFPKPVAAHRISSYIHQTACNYLTNITVKLLTREDIAPEQSLDAMYDQAEKQGSTSDSVEGKLGERDSGVIYKGKKEEEVDESALLRRLLEKNREILSETKKEEKKKNRNAKTVNPQVSGLIDPLLHDPEERAIIEDRLQEAIEKADLSKVRTRELVEEVIGRREERRVLLEYGDKFLEFENPVDMLKAVENYDDLNQYTFHSFKTDQKIEERLFPSEDVNIIHAIQLDLEEVQTHCGYEEVILGISINENPKVSVNPDDLHTLYRESVLREPARKVNEVVSALLLQDFKKAYFHELD